ncbi:pyocin activator PrtN family protein [Pseudomonas monsensis]|uniref:Pyocin activator PrtN family protein n=1 Tax=Pseudomonas monsensis TaxID=2745509 RepID=A0ABT3Z1C2_9PSED|nr:pyocin activator PrtN family protein [Pseudomonas monsensis]MCY0111574.1 pyocin activator PrtN family protein [Pseudomonas monsensis]MDZ3829793.1 pyocin activator PrtN family protein [Pseudomonas monsensis]
MPVRGSAAAAERPSLHPDQVCKDYFTHLTTDMFQRKVLAGQIKIPITRLESSQKSTKGIHLSDLATYLDLQRDSALKELRQINR